MQQITDTSLPLITKHFDKFGHRRWVQPELDALLSDRRDEWQLPQQVTSSEFFTFFLESTQLVRVALKFPNRPAYSLWWGAPSLFEVASAIDPKGYFSHQTASYLNGLIESEPDLI